MHAVFAATNYESWCCKRFAAILRQSKNNKTMVRMLMHHINVCK